MDLSTALELSDTRLDQSAALPAIAKPKVTTPVPGAQWFCPVCKATAEPSPYGRCPRCHGQLVEYTVEKLGKLLWDQMAILEEGKRVDEENRRLKRQVEALTREVQEATRVAAAVSADTKYYHLDSGKIVKESETVAAGIVGRVRIGWEGQVYALNESGLGQLCRNLRITSLVSTPPSGLAAEVAALRKENERLKAQLASQATPSAARRIMR